MSNAHNLTFPRVGAMAGAALASLLVAGWVYESGALRIEQGDERLAYASGPEFDWVGQPAGIEQLVRDADAIIVGSVIRIVSRESVYPHGIDRTAPQRGTGIEFTNIEVRVERVLQGKVGGTILLRQMGDLEHSLGFREFPRPEVGKPMLLFLTRESSGENVWASDLGPWGRAIESGGTMRFCDGDATEIPWFKGMRLDAAERATRAAIG